MSAPIAQAAAPAAPAGGNMSLGQLSAMFQKPKAAAGDPSAAAPKEPAPSAPSEPAPRGRGRKIIPAAAAPAAPAPAEPPPVEPAEPASPEPPAELAEPAAPVEPGEPGEPAEPGEPGAEPTEGDEPKALPAEVQAALDELKASGDNTGAKLVKRIHKLADQRDMERLGRLQAEQRAQQAEARAQELAKNPQAAAIPQGDRYASHPEIAAIDKQMTTAEQVLEWAEANPDGAELEGKTFTAQQVSQLKRNAESNRARLTAQREAKTANYQQAEQADRVKLNTQARQLYPWITKQDSPEYGQAVALLKAMPALWDIPGTEIVVGRYIEGMKAEKARLSKPAGAAAPAKPAVKPPPMANGASAALARVTPEPNAGKKQISVRDLASQFAKDSAAKRTQQRAAA